MTLEDFTSYFAAVVAFLGAFVVAPQGTVLLFRRAGRPWQWARVRLARHFAFLRRTVTVSGEAASAWEVATAGHARVRPGWPARPTVKSLAAAVRDWLERVDEEVNAVWIALSEERENRAKEIAKARRELQMAIHALQTRMTEAEKVAAESDSRGIPVLGMGAVMGIIPDRFAALSPWLYWPILGVVAGLTVSATLGAWRLRHAVR